MLVVGVVLLNVHHVLLVESVLIPEHGVLAVFSLGALKPSTKLGPVLGGSFVALSLHLFTLEIALRVTISFNERVVRVSVDVSRELLIL